jgi:two-component system, LytTR family, sensor kinase
MQVTRSFLDRLYELLSRRPVYHTLFWVVMFISLLWLDFSQNHDWHLALVNEGITLFFYAILVYTNLLYLIPQFMARSAVVYLVMVVVTSAIVTPIQVFVLFIRFSDNASFREMLIDQQKFLFLANILVTLLATVLRVIMDWWRYQMEKQELVTQNIQSELRFLKSQINPHFLFNTLNNLFALTLKKSDDAPQVVLKLSEIMRYMLYECNEKEVLLSKEIQYMHNYLELERLRLPKGADITFETNGHVSHQMVAPLLFVPFVENAFKHGMNNHLTGGGFIRMTMNVADDALEFIVENSKTDNLPRQDHPRSGGIGLANVRQRLRILYPDAHDLEISDEPGCYRVTLRLNL